MAERHVDLGKGQILLFDDGKAFLSTPDKCAHVTYDDLFKISHARELLVLHGDKDLASPVVLLAVYNELIVDDNQWVELCDINEFHYLKSNFSLYTKGGTRIYFIAKTRYNQYKLIFEGGLHTFLSEHAIVRKVNR